MILHSLRIDNFKGIRGSLELDFDPNAPNLLEGPNGIGKSTLVEAVERCLLDSHNATGASAEEMRPRETALAPSVSVEFSHSGTVYRIAKTFLDSPRAQLDRRRADGTYDPIAKGKAADEQVREMLRGQPTKAKDRPGERMGLLSVLWSAQGRPELPALSGDALADIRGMLGAQVSGTRGAAFEQVVTKKHFSLWTPGNKPKKGRLSEVQTALTAARQDLARYGELMVRVGNLESSARDQRSRSKEGLDQLRIAQAEYRPLAITAQRVTDLRARRIPAESLVAAADARYSQLRAEIDRITEAGNRKRSCEGAQPRLEDAEASARRTRDVRIREASTARGAWELSCQPGPQLGQIETRIDRGTTFLRLGKELESTRGRLERAASAARSRNRLNGEIAGLNAPDAPTWKLIQAVGCDFDQATMKVEALALRLEITAKTSLRTNVILGEPAGEAQLHAGQSLVARGDGLLTVSLPGIALLKFAGPSGDAAHWRARRDERHLALELLLGPFAVSAWQDLADRVHRREALAGELAVAKAEYEAAIGSDTADHLQESERESAAGYEEILAIEPSWAQQLPDLGALKTESAVVKKALEACQGEAGKEWGAAETRRADAEASAGAAAEALAANNREFLAAQQTLALLEADGLNAIERQERLAERRRECETARDGLSEIDAELAGLPKDAPEHAAAVQGRIAVIEPGNQAAREAYQQDEAAVRAILLQRPYTSLAITEERVRQLEADEAAETVRLGAIQLLKISVDAAKAKVMDGIAKPVEARATAILDRIAGRPIARIRLGDGMALQGVQPEGCSGNAAVDQMSGGEQEQIYFATRLAPAEIMAGQERHTLVFDDPLVHTDGDRLIRILELINECSDRLQFVILTCHPERYIELHGAASRHMAELEPSATETAEMGA